MIDFMHELADEAGAILRGHYRRLGADDVRMKERMDPVTVADQAVERRLVALIGERFPDHAILAEEFTDTRRPSGPLWVIDPLDGTMNYLHGLPNVCTSLAYLEDGVPRAAMVNAPFLDERYAAVRGGGATCNGEPIRVSSATELGRTLLCTGYADLRKYGDATNLRAWCRLAPRCAGIRRYGAAALDLCWVACGRFDGFWERSLSPWDVAAGGLIVEEAGGVVRDLGREGFDPMNGSLVAAAPGIAAALHDEVMAAVDGEGEGGTDETTSLAEIKAAMERFVAERAWGRYHNPKNVAVSIAIEAAELMEIFQWMEPDEARNLKDDPARWQHATEELSDILAYAASLANFLGIDVASAFRRKMAKNRLKYPVDRFHGTWTKPVGKP